MANTYNGHKNWAYWNVALWLDNDEGLYRMKLSYLRHARTKDMAARQLRDALHDAGLLKTPDGAAFSLSAIRAALAGD